MTYSPSKPSSSPKPISSRLRELEDAWTQDELDVQAVDELRELNEAATNGADKHLAFCLIEQLEGRPIRNDGEVQRLLHKRDNVRWQKKLIYISAPTKTITSPLMRR